MDERVYDLPKLGVSRAFVRKFHDIFSCISHAINSALKHHVWVSYIFISHQNNYLRYFYTVMHYLGVGRNNGLSNICISTRTLKSRGNVIKSVILTKINVFSVNFFFFFRLYMIYRTRMPKN